MSLTRMRARRATINDVADAAGLSRGTVSRVVNGEKYVSAEARMAVEAAIAQVGYVRNTAARNLVTQESRAIGLIIHEPHSLLFEDPNIGSILLGANEALSKADYQLVTLIIDSDRDSHRVADHLRGGLIDGAVIVSARASDPIAAAVADIGLPAAFVGHPDGTPDLPYAAIDNVEAARAITSRLLGTGRQRVGMIASALDRDSGQDRLAGFRAAMGERYDPRLVVEYPLYTYAAGFEGMQKLLRRDPSIDGVFAASDAVAAGAMTALQEAGRRVPEDVGIVGFDDSSWALRCRPQLSTVRQPAGLLGTTAAELVLAQLMGLPSSPRVLETVVMWRGSA
ncbi:LacI family transcriptional regulator [Arthrobacter frigidicola]|uniref:LacI family transcriptional regulator n=1 Tax=Arthrobacter crusticola TaxID=2547960 RepID=A0A4R5TW32_9MICC|nr:LacI family DNA-binding transcriptional regulator [Arthrobacter crusticola]RJU00880.1 LacI family transcriptional regulator [Arthrobacter frigidicola]TDK25344.1 LacI family transcriptional regulator [Arthrobacter crusticola]